MVIERPPDWMPSFSYGSVRSPHPSSSAPGLRSNCNRPQSPHSSDDEGSSTNITNRCSPKSVYAIVSKLSKFKKQLVHEIGFGGILDLPCINKVNLRFSAWLLSKLDTERSELVFGESRRIYVHEKDVGIVFGIPCGEIDISSTKITSEEMESIKLSCGMSTKDSRSFKGIEHILQKPLDDSSSKEERDSFKIAFVIFVMGHLLAPSVKHDCVNLDFWGALKDTELFERMNWCRYVFSHVIDAAQKVQDEIIRKNRVTNLSGCHLFLQVLFLDNVDIRGLNKNHSELPRIKFFDADSLKQMTTMCESRGGNDFNSFLGIRPPGISAYMRHMNESRTTGPCPPVTSLPPTPASGRLLSAETYSFREHSDFSAYIRERYPNLNKLYIIDQIKLHNAKMVKEISNFRSSIMRLNAMFLDWLVSNVCPDDLAKIQRKPSPSTAVRNNSDTRDCTTLQTGIVDDRNQVGKIRTSLGLKRANVHDQSDEVKKHRLDIDPPSFDLGIDISPVHGSFATPKAQVIPMKAAISPIPFGTNSASAYHTSSSAFPLSPISASIKFATELVEDMIDTIEDGSSQTDYVLFGQDICENYTLQPYMTPVRAPSCTKTALSPEPEILDMLHIYVRESKHIDGNSLWIEHPLPKHLVVSAKDFKDNFLTPMLTEFYVVDALIRRLNQLDDTVTHGEIKLRWRHFLECDFAMQSISGFCPEHTQSVLNQFIHMEYSICTCQMIIIPVLVHDIWSAYMYDMYEGVVHILDPGHSPVRYSAHIHFHEMINASMAHCFQNFFTGWNSATYPKWEIQYPKLCDSFGSEDSAFCMLHLARHYNGYQLETLINKDDMLRLRLKFLFEALSLEHNEAELPSMIARLIRQE